MSKHTPGPWHIDMHGNVMGDGQLVAFPGAATGQPQEANARLIAAAPEQNEEMLRYLPILERAEADPELWGRLTQGLGIATLNGYRAAIAKATGAEA